MRSRTAAPPPRPVTRKRRGKQAVTVHDVAKIAGVSIITVSRALNNPSVVSPETLARVQAAVAKTSYVPNLMAGGLRSARSRLVVALVPTIITPLFASAIDALTRSLEAEGYQLMVGQIGYSHSREDRLLEAIIGRRPDGIVLTGVMHSEQGRKRLIASGIPVVETWDFTQTPIDMLVGFSHDAVGYQVCEYLAGRGRKRLALIGADDERAKRRKEGFLRAAKKLGLREPLVHFVAAPATHASGREGLAEVLKKHADIDAVFGSSDTVAMGVMTEARARGIAVPKSLAVIGFGDVDFSASLEPALSTVRIDGAELGRIAAQFIVESAEGTRVKKRVVDIGFEIVERAST
jgi:LacI family gluconate utilization system Gnt-I transcriptional repressor